MQKLHFELEKLDVENFDIKLKTKDRRNTMAEGTEVAIVSEENSSSQEQDT